MHDKVESWVIECLMNSSHIFFSYYLNLKMYENGMFDRFSIHVSKCYKKIINVIL